MHVLDLAVMGLYFALIAYVGYRTGRGNQGIEDYFLAKPAMPWSWRRALESRRRNAHRLDDWRSAAECAAPSPRPALPSSSAGFSNPTIRCCSS